MTRVRRLLEPSGRVSVTLEKPDWNSSKNLQHRFESSIGRNDLVSDDISIQTRGEAYEVAAPTEENRYIRSLFGPTFQTFLPDSVENARIVVRMDGHIVQRRPLTDLEKEYLEWYSQTTDDPTHLDPVPIQIGELTAEDAVRVASSLAVPTGSSNRFQQRC
ncbi:hypothetical protein C439_13514 [Haloferax mediterranei ATCC 33500]|uniref:Uncharacterized protein n=2 Tax=Haloferax mediterranei (strain ATCC 33500 / DSM 1411 / JCM 8866 / NBRC 14739 / NCIMB 2177 / R-4) TaxID=523841 RepID=M0IS90_HALMT|nr:hypothetical protein BM92_12490 [Haloferax mediterranei ATCC 33500]ELZ99575.1 hypothetical protein C439_13514 [Haloferax mediterranei ATCC 33500]